MRSLEEERDKGLVFYWKGAASWLALQLVVHNQGMSSRLLPAT